MRRQFKLAILAVGLTLGLFGLAPSTLAQGRGAANETPPVLTPVSTPPAVPPQAPGAANEVPPVLPPSPPPPVYFTIRQMIDLRLSAAATESAKILEASEKPPDFQPRAAALAPSFDSSPPLVKRASEILAQIERPTAPQSGRDYAVLSPALISEMKAEAMSELREGIRLSEKGDYRAAIYHFDASLRLDETLVLAYERRAFALCKMEAYDKAISDLNKMIELDPTQLYHRCVRARVHYWKQNYVRAIEDLNVIISTTPTKQFEAYFRFEAYLLRAVIFEVTGDFRAAGDFEEALKLAPQDQETLQRLAWLYAGCPDEIVRNGRRAIELATRACELDGWKSCHSLAVLAAAHAETGDYDAARRWQERATQLASGSYRLECLGRQIRFALRHPYRYSIHEEPPEGYKGYWLGWHFDPNIGLCIRFKVIRPTESHEIHLPLCLLAIRRL